jgi:hypothetical protein
MIAPPPDALSEPRSGESKGSPHSRISSARVLAALVILVWAGEAAAHPMGPATLQIAESKPGVARATMQQPAAAPLTPRWPRECDARMTGRAVEGANIHHDYELVCTRGIAGLVIGVDGLAARDTIAIVRIQLAGGGVVREILGPSRPSFMIPPETSWLHTLGQHVRLGVEHLLGGLDHLLFIVALLLAVPRLRDRAITLTAFTAGHSVTLALAALGVVAVPAAPVEILIAITLIVVALQALDGRARHTWPLAAGFGLVHGLGFAGALTGAGLPAGDLPLALAGFNLGIELGQLALAAAFLALAALARPLARRAGPYPRLAAAYTVGAIAAMYVLERTAAALA